MLFQSTQQKEPQVQTVHQNGHAGNGVVRDFKDRFQWSLKQHEQDPAIPLERPEILHLAVALCELGYSFESRTAILSQAAADGHLEGLCEIDPGDRERLDWAFETGFAALPLTAAAWDEKTNWTGQGPIYRSTGPAFLADAWTFSSRALAHAIGRLEIARANLIPPELDPEYEPTDQDWADYRAAAEADDAAWYRDHPREA
jgi:hypothetical protein